MPLIDPSSATLAWVWQPIVSPMHIFAGAIVLAALAIFAYARTFAGRERVSGFLLAMRLTMIVVVSVLLMGPSSVPPSQTRVVRPKVRILVDTSESMQTQDCDGSSRMEFVAKKVLPQDRLRELNRDFEIELSAFDQEVRGLPQSRLARDVNSLATGRATLLSSSVRAGLAKVPTTEENAFLVVVSDGRDSQSDSIQPAAVLAKNRNIPVHTISVGGQSLQSDLAVLAVPMQEYLLPGEPGSILVKIYQSGNDNASTTLRIRQGDDTKEIPVSFHQDRVVEMQVPIKQDESGQYDYIVSVDPIGKEAETSNNEQTVFCDVQKKRIRALILEGQPFWDSKFLAQSLRKDDRIEVTQITQLSTAKRETLVTRVEKGTPKVPATPEEWAAYDLVIVGQALENILSGDVAAQLDDFVANHGGHVIFARGLAYDPATADGQRLQQHLAKLEPVIWGNGSIENASLSLTPTGRTSQWLSTGKVGLDIESTLARLPGFQRAPIIAREKPATIVLAQASPGAAANAPTAAQPAIVQMSYGRGTVVAILGDGVWKWSLLPPELQDLAGFYDTFWSNLVRWLAMGGDFRPDQQVALHVSRTNLRKSDKLLVDVIYKHTPATGAHPKLEMKSPAGTTQEVALQPVPSREPRFRALIEPETTGVYHLSLQTPGMQPAALERKFSVYDINEEKILTSADPMSLRVLAEHSGGKYYDSTNFADLFSELERHRASMLVPPNLEYIWDQGMILVLLLIWTGLEWILRRFAGLL